MWKCGDFSLNVQDRCHLIGILNVNAVSHFRFQGQAALDKAIQMVEEGADVIEVGGESARPGATPTPAVDEAATVIPVIEALVEKLRVPITIDTNKALVARAALDAGASIVNDISSMSDSKMAPLLAGRECGVVLMHMRGTPLTMQQMTDYDDVAGEVARWLCAKAAEAEGAGIQRNRIVVDQGLGLAKNRHQCLSLVKRISELAAMGYPVLVSPSNKSFIGRTLNIPPAKRLMGTLAVVAWSVSAGAGLIRVHDVGKASRVVKMTEAIFRAQ
ncbi:MAG: dihydropteroate synthase [Actinomycetota bacterium]